MNWWLLGGATVYLAVVVFAWALCRAAALADRDADRFR